MALLKIHSPSRDDVYHELTKEQTSIGRSSNNDIVLSDSTISRNHAVIARHGVRFTLEDLGSRNRTAVDGTEVTTPVVLRHGARVEFGRSKAVFVERESDLSETLVRLTASVPGVTLVSRSLEHVSAEDHQRGLLQQEFIVAGEIQKLLLPGCGLSFNGLTVLGDNKPCYEVGGDFFDYQVGPNGTVGMVLGDVTGHGVGAAVLGHYAQAIIRTGMNYVPRLEDLADLVNKEICAHSAPNKFVAACICAVHPLTGEVQYVNAGQCKPLLLRRDGSIRLVEGSDILLGVIEEAVYQTRRVWLEPGDMFVLYSDGFTECRNDAGDEYGEIRLQEFLSRRPNVEPETIVRDVEEEFERFVGEAQPSDDMSILILRRNETETTPFVG